MQSLTDWTLVVNLPPIKHASLTWNEQGTPVSREFGDVYFSNENGLEETRYVFLSGNDLPARFCRHSRPQFVVAETGFGTGLNFLALWQCFRQFRQRQPDAVVKSLRFISFEKFPLLLDDLIAAHRFWPELTELASLLQAQWPPATPGRHRLSFDNDSLTLDLWFADVNQALPQLRGDSGAAIDCWFLDGFAPAKNSDMWNDALFEQMANLTNPGGTFATFTAAGFVRRGLQQAGFEVKKIKGFGSKREMLTGTKPPERFENHEQL